MKNFANKTAVITGGGGGIGKALAHMAADRQMNVVLLMFRKMPWWQQLVNLKTDNVPSLASIPTPAKRP